MPSRIDEFGRTAQRLARNPLGIIALFLVLVYGIAGLVLGLSASSLAAGERQPLVWFLVAFPVLVLVVFYQMVTKHHVKLYAPQDFPDAEGFFRALTPREQRERLDEEIRELESVQAVPAAESKELQLPQKPGVVGGIPPRHAWILAEELVFRELEREFGVAIIRQVAVASDRGVDGIFEDKGGTTRIVEVKFVKHVHLTSITRKAAEQLRDIANRFGDRHKAASFILVIVVEALPEAYREREVKRTRQLLSSMPFPVDLRIYDFGELKEKYGAVDEPT